MTGERWEQVKRVFHEAAACPPGTRESYLLQACGDDQEQRREVERLLEVATAAGSFLEKPAIEIAARAMAGEHRAVGPATRMGP